MLMPFFKRHWEFVSALRWMINQKCVLFNMLPSSSERHNWKLWCVDDIPYHYHWGKKTWNYWTFTNSDVRSIQHSVNILCIYKVSNHSYYDLWHQSVWPIIVEMHLSLDRLILVFAHYWYVTTAYWVPQNVVFL